MIFTLGCNSNKLNQGDTNERLDIDKKQIKQINISAFPDSFKEINISEAKQISNVVDYLVSIKPVTTNKNPDEYVGGGYLIEIQFKDKSERVFNHLGNIFLIEKGNFKYEMQYEEAIKIDSIVANILESNQEKNGQSSIVGTIVSVKSESSGRNVSCVIKDKDNVSIDLDLNNASIIDSTGNGWMILHEKDEVKIYYTKDKPLKEGQVLATTVFINKTTK
jgi:hypothetical protein